MRISFRSTVCSFLFLFFVSSPIVLRSMEDLGEFYAAWTDRDDEELTRAKPTDDASSGLWETIKDDLYFLRTFLRDPAHRGAILPSSQRLAEAITRCLPDARTISSTTPAKRYLEVGAGTGVFTRKIIKDKIRCRERLSSDSVEDTFDVVEFAEEDCQKLHRQFDDYRNIHILCVSILDFNPALKYDAIISGLPFNAFQSEDVKKILDKYLRFLTPNGIVSFFEYKGVAKMRRAWNILSAVFGEKFEKKRLDFERTLAALETFKKSFRRVTVEEVDAFALSTDLQIPSARVITCSEPLVSSLHLD